MQRFGEAHGGGSTDGVERETRLGKKLASFQLWPDLANVEKNLGIRMRRASTLTPRTR